MKVLPRRYLIPTRTSRNAPDGARPLRIVDAGGRTSDWRCVGEAVVNGEFAVVDGQVTAMGRKGRISAYPRRFPGRRKVVTGNDVALMYQPREPRVFGPSTTVIFFARPRADTGAAVAEGQRLTAKLQRRVDRHRSDAVSLSAN